MYLSIRRVTIALAKDPQAVIVAGADSSPYAPVTFAVLPGGERGPEALRVLLRELPADIDVPIVVARHLGTPGSTR